MVNLLHVFSISKISFQYLVRFLLKAKTQEFRHTYQATIWNSFFPFRLTVGGSKRSNRRR